MALEDLDGAGETGQPTPIIEITQFMGISASEVAKPSHSAFNPLRNPERWLCFKLNFVDKEKIKNV